MTTAVLTRSMGLLASSIILLATPVATAQTTSTTNKINVQQITWDEVKTNLADHPLAVVDLWSLSCAPCLEEFPGLVKLQSEHGDKIHCIGVSVDYDGRRRSPPETYLARVQAFVTAAGATEIENILCTTPSDDVLEDVDAASIPTVLIYQNGKLVQKFVDAGATAGFTYEKDVAPAIKELLKP